jgi:hypothetical protein
MFPHHRFSSIATITAGLVLIVGIVLGALFFVAAPRVSAASPCDERVFDKDTTINCRFVLRPGDSIVLLNGACLCFGPGGSADWQGTPTSTWSDDGNTQNLERDIEITGNGHIRFETGSGVSTIRYVEIDLQPPVERAKYPLHWHHAGEGSRGTVVEGVVVKNSTNRAFVPHASHGITFRDTIAMNIDGDAYWWDPPSPSGNESNNSNNITYDHALADGVTPSPGDKGHRLAAFRLGSGSGNTVIDSVAMNVVGGKEASGFQWPEHVAGPRSWRFENNTAHHNSANGIFVWQNSSIDHLIDGYRGYANGNSDIDHGAYKNIYAYRDVTVDHVEVHALGWSVIGGTIGTIETRKHRLDGSPVTFSGVAVGRLIVDNAGGFPGHYVFTNTGLSFNNVTVKSAEPGTRVSIDGKTRFAVSGGLTLFSDVSRKNIFVNDIEWLADKGVTKGCNPPTNSRYCPDKTVTRGQMAAFVARVLGLPGSNNDYFRDDNDSVFENDINRVATAGITKGCNPPKNDQFCPDSKLNRGQMAAFLVRARGYTNDGGGDRFIDDNGLVFERDIDRLATAGVTKGCNPPKNDRFCPNDPVTRAQMAAFLHRAFG